MNEELIAESALELSFHILPVAGTATQIEELIFVIDSSLKSKGKKKGTS